MTRGSYNRNNKRHEKKHEEEVREMNKKLENLG